MAVFSVYANPKLAPIGKLIWAPIGEEVGQFVHLDYPQWVEESVYLSRFWANGPYLALVFAGITSLLTTAQGEGFVKIIEEELIPLARKEGCIVVHIISVTLLSCHFILIL